MKRYGYLLLLIILSMLFLPVCAYVVGIVVVGPYEGDSGLFGYLGSIIAGAFAGSWSAWVLLLTPGLLLGLWYAVLWLLRRGQSAEASQAGQ